MVLCLITIEISETPPAESDSAQRPQNKQDAYTVRGAPFDPGVATERGSHGK